MLQRLNAVTKKSRRRQRAATTANANDLDYDEGGSSISWALTIVFLIHVVALCLVFIHHRFISGRPNEQVAMPVAEAPAQVAAVAQPSSPKVLESQVTAGEIPYIVRAGDTYESIAKLKDVSVNDLRAINENVGIRAGYILKLPVKRVMVKVTPSEPAASPALAPKPAVRPAREEGLVAAIDTSQAPKATVVGSSASSSDEYVVKSGDSVWGIAKRYGVSQDVLMKANGIKDARKLFVGMKLKIP